MTFPCQRVPSRAESRYVASVSMLNSVAGTSAARRVVRSALCVAFAALVLASCGEARSGTTPPRSHPTPIATSVLDPNSLCPPDEGDNVHQLLNGDFTGCFRVPNLRSSSVVVALQAFVEGVSNSPTTALTTTTTPAPTVSVSLSSVRKTVRPGEQRCPNGTSQVNPFRLLAKLLPISAGTAAEVWWNKVSKYVGCPHGSSR